MDEFPGLRVLDHIPTDDKIYIRRFTDSIILTGDGKILLQQRPLNWQRSPGTLNAFGGEVEAEETSLQALVRELKEELGADVLPMDVVSLGALTETFTNHTELVYAHFWHDRHNTITGCYEGEAAFFDHIFRALGQPNLMEYTRWMLLECQMRGLLNAR